VAADDLRQAAGKVRCGDCGAAFDALLYLSEDLPEPAEGATPEPALPELKPESKAHGSKLPDSISANESIALLQTLDDLAGSDIRIEDTGIEWRVLDEVAMSDMATDAARADDQPAPDTEIRYDDNSPLPDDLSTDEAADEVTDDTAVIPDALLATVEIDDAEVDDSGDWEAILDEFVEPADESDANDELNDETASFGDLAEQLDVDTAVEDAGDAADETKDDNDIEIVLEGDDSLADETIAEPDEIEVMPPESASASPPDEDTSPSQWQLLDDDEQVGEQVDEQVDSIPTLSEARYRPAGGGPEDQDDDQSLETDEDVGIESIIMEGDTVRFALDDMEAAAGLHAAVGQVDLGATHAGVPAPKQSPGRRIGLLLLLLVLLSTLGLQAVHQQRESLARIPLVNEFIGPVYRAIGKPLAPAWDVTGWSFEATTGNIDDDERLTIYTRIGNRSDEAMPYPLIGVSLTDRYAEVIGSRVLDPSSYLASDVNPRRLVASGENFEAFISVESPEATASGYKLDVCYRRPDRRLRCSIGDFR
jgi:hypothetical protein